MIHIRNASVCSVIEGMFFAAIRSELIGIRWSWHPRDPDWRLPTDEFSQSSLFAVTRGDRNLHDPSYLSLNWIVSSGGTHAQR
jgi:hypothetical protein